MDEENDRLLGWRQVKEEGYVSDKSRVTVWRWEKDGLFPKRIQIGPNSVAWSERQLKEWRQKKMEAAHAAIA